MITIYVVFDCTRTIGYKLKTRFHWLAYWSCVVLTKLTGRMHDYLPYGVYLSLE